MGQHKYNPTAIAAAKGEIPPKSKNKSNKKVEDPKVTKTIHSDSFKKLLQMKYSDLEQKISESDKSETNK